MTALPLEVDGGLRIGGDKATGSDRFPVEDPATGDVIAEVGDGSEDDARSAVDAAADALGAWAATAPRDRAEVLRRTFELMTERATSLADTMPTSRPPSTTSARPRARGRLISWRAASRLVEGDTTAQSRTGVMTSAVVLVGQSPCGRRFTSSSVTRPTSSTPSTTG